MANLVKIQFLDNTTFFVSPNAPIRLSRPVGGWIYATIDHLNIYGARQMFEVWNGEDWVPAKLAPARKRVQRKFELVVEFEVPADEDDERDTIVSVEQDVVAMLGTITEDSACDTCALTIVSIDSGPAD